MQWLLQEKHVNLHTAHWNLRTNVYVVTQARECHFFFLHITREFEHGDPRFSFIVSQGKHEATNTPTPTDTNGRSKNTINTTIK